MCISLFEFLANKLKMIFLVNGKITKTKTELKVTFENDSYSILFVDNDSSRAIPVHEENKLYIPSNINLNYFGDFKNAYTKKINV